jgi:pterin-4a-carbinolamine dehydratase
LNVYKKIEIAFTTHDVGGLSPHDDHLARCVDQASSASFMPRLEVQP